MSTGTQPELAPETEFDVTDELIEQACRAHDAAVAAYGVGRGDAAEQMFRRAITLFEQAADADVCSLADLAAALGNLGAVYEARCAYLQAEECYARGTAIAAELEDEGAEEVAHLRLQALSNYGRILRRQGSYAQAEPFIRCALAFAEARFGAASLLTAWALNDLGMFGKFTSRFDEAADCYQRALAILEKHYGADCAEAASLYHNLGGLEHARGRFAEGEPWTRQSVVARERALGLVGVGARFVRRADGSRLAAGAALRSAGEAINSRRRMTVHTAGAFICGSLFCAVQAPQTRSRNFFLPMSDFGSRFRLYRRATLRRWPRSRGRGGAV